MSSPFHGKTFAQTVSRFLTKSTPPRSACNLMEQLPSSVCSMKYFVIMVVYTDYLMVLSNILCVCSVCSPHQNRYEDAWHGFLGLCCMTTHGPLKGRPYRHKSRSIIYSSLSPLLFSLSPSFLPPQMAVAET